jgi:general secretion pathway protein J
MSGQRPPRRGAAGFTLIELLVTLALMGLISVLLFDGIRLGARVWDASSDRLSAVEEVSAVQNILRQLLEEAVLVRQRVADRTQRTFSFQGTADSVRFVAPLPIHRGVGGLYVLALTPSDRGAGLMLGWRAHRPDVPFADDAEELADSSPLLSGIAGVRFAYYGSMGDEARPSWHEEWDGSANLPELIRIDVTFSRGDPRVWPELVVAVKGAPPAPAAP